MQNVPDPKSFYNNVMPGKVDGDYERARWGANPLLAAQYRMMTDLLGRFVAPSVRTARRVLEVGPGPGTWTKQLLAANPRAAYTLVDISKEMLAQARAELAGEQHVAFVESDLLEFDSSQPFDFFFSSRAIEYMPDKQVVAHKIASLLSQGARGAIITKMPKPFFDRMRGRAPRVLHSSQIRPDALADLLRAEGLGIEKVRIATATVPFLRSARLNTFAYWLLKHIPLVPPLTLFAESYILTFRKSI